MTDNTRQIIEKMQASFPHLYNIYDKKTILYALISAFGERFGARTDTIDRLYAMIGIDSTYDEDLEHRWGSLLGVHKQANESYNDYRSRLLIVYSSLAGGTAEAIKYAIASVIGINEDVDKYIKVYDAWKYPYEVNETMSKSYGNIICTIDQQLIDKDVLFMNDKIIEAINETKASGINPYLLFIYTINEMASLSRDDESYDDIILSQDDTGSVNSNDELYNDIILSQNDTGSVNRTNVGIWSHFGTNSSLLNINFTTNMKMETDSCIDRIILSSNEDNDSSSDNNSNSNTAVFGEAVFGSAIFGND